MSQKNIGQLQNILNQAAEEGVISQKALAVIDINDTVLAGLNGTDVDDIEATEVTLLTLIYDDSGSIDSAKLVGAIRKGQNELIDAIGGSKEKDNILIAQWKLGSKTELVHSYLPADQAVRLDSNNYNPHSGTALYDVWVEVAAANVAYAQQLRASGTPEKNIIVIITDGWDQGSKKYRAEDCCRLNQDLLKSERFILAFVGVGNTAQDEQDFRQIAQDMGFPDGAVLTAKATATEIRKVFNLVSQKSLTASQKAISITAQNSFFAP